MLLSDFSSTIRDLLNDFGPEALVTFYPEGISFGGTKHNVAIDFDDPEDTVDEWAVFTFYDVDSGSPLTLQYLADKIADAEFASIDSAVALYFVDYDGNALNNGDGDPSGMYINIGTPEDVEEFYL